MKLHLSIPSLAMLHAFEAFGREGGVRKAAQSLDIDHAIVSRHLRGLEQFVGTGLIDRSHARHALTAEGRRYHQKVTAALQDLAHATEALRGREKSDLKIWCLPGFAYNWLSRRLVDFIVHYPNIELEMRPSDREPDFAFNEADADIRYIRNGDEQLVPPDVRRIEIARPLVYAVCSPELAATFGEIRSAAELLDLPLLHEENDVEWRMWLRGQGTANVPERLPGLRLWHAHHALEAARLGRGIALGNPLILGSDIADGRLVALQVDGKPASCVVGGYNLLAREDRWNSKSFAIFRTWLHDQMRA